MPQSIPAGLSRDHVLRALSDLDTGIDHPFGAATGYDLIHNGKRYAPKTVIGLACRDLIGRVLQPDEFSGGEAPGQANFVLRQLGFTVLKKTPEDKEPPAGKDWSEQEVQLIVADYFSMLEAELRGHKYKKSEHRKTLIPQLSGRSDGSIEFKHQNVSGVLVDLGLPYIEGYKPRRNYQSLLYAEVEAFLSARPGYLEQLAESPVLNPTLSQPVANLNIDQVIEEPPERLTVPAAIGKPWLTRRARQVDFVERDAANRRLGRLGEEFVLELERRRLLHAGRDDLARKVLWASQEIGDGLGFDIISFNEADDSERMLEVKATGSGKFFPFYVTSNEVRCSVDIPQQYQLYRLFDFGRAPRLYILHGSLRELCQLEPVLYRAGL